MCCSFRIINEQGLNYSSYHDKTEIKHVDNKYSTGTVRDTIRLHIPLQKSVIYIYKSIVVSLNVKLYMCSLGYQLHRRFVSDNCCWDKLVSGYTQKLHICHITTCSYVG